MSTTNKIDICHFGFEVHDNVHDDDDGLLIVSTQILPSSWSTYAIPKRGSLATLKKGIQLRLEVVCGKG